MEEKILEKRLVDIEINLTNQEKMLDELSDIIAEQAKTLDILKKQHEQLLRLWQENSVKPQNEETPPPHY
ncbi:MAG: SlyX family protein [Alphaproteobacteria bacterium]|nr:SlyX family protein [Alphaproteobacteria bacterium]